MVDAEPTPSHGVALRAHRGFSPLLETAMTALPASNPKTFDHAALRDLANHWLEHHHTDLIRLARFTHANLNWDAREEAVAETVAYTAKAVHGATRNGTLQTLTPRAIRVITRGIRTIRNSSRTRWDRRLAGRRQRLG